MIYKTSFPKIKTFLMFWWDIFSSSSITLSSKAIYGNVSLLDPPLHPQKIALDHQNRLQTTKIIFYPHNDPNPSPSSSTPLPPLLGKSGYQVTCSHPPKP